MPRKRIFAAGLVAALIFIFPLRVLMAMADTPLSAQFVGGFVWGGRAVGAQVAGVPLGDLRLALSPLALLTGKVRLTVDGAVRGALIGGIGASGADVEALDIPAMRSLGPVQVTRVELTGARIRFGGQRCAEAEGQMAVTIAASPGLSLPSGRFAGPLRCNGDGLSAMLVSQSAMDRLSLRFSRGGRYEAVIVTRPSDAGAGATLRAGGFRETPAGFSMRVAGAL